jgi:hypothetical protein
MKWKPEKTKPRQPRSIRVPLARATLESFGSAPRDIGPITPGMSLALLTRGQFSQIDALVHILEQVGPADVTLWSATIAEENEATAFHTPELFRSLIRNPLIKSGLLVTEHGVLSESKDLVAAWQERFGPESVRYASMHAKIITARTDAVDICMRGSLTLNASQQMENLDLCDSAALCDHIHELELRLPALPRWATDTVFEKGLFE